MWGDFGCLPIDDPSFIDGEGSTRLQQSIEAIQDRGTEHSIHDKYNICAFFSCQPLDISYSYSTVLITSRIES